MSKIKTIGILTSGGDAPGMNAAIRAVTRAGIYNGFNIKGIYRGYDGLIKGEVKPFTTENVSGIITRGGTILKTARSKEFMTLEGMQKAYEPCQKEEIDALVVIGGNGSLTGARNFGMEFDFPCIGLPGTIDNDLYGTDSTIGYDTTMNTIMDCVDRIRDTANSHERIFFVEVMGRDAGFLAQNSAIACGAEAAIIPEEMMEEDQLEVEEVVHRHRFREPQVRRSLLCRPREKRVPRVRCSRQHPRPLAARRQPLGSRPHPGQSHRRRRHRSHQAGPAQRHGWRAQQRGGLRALL